MSPTLGGESRAGSPSAAQAWAETFSRNRDLFPLPAVSQPAVLFEGSKSVTARLKKRFARQEEINQAISALNEMFCGRQAPPGAKATAAQRQAQQQLFSTWSSSPSPILYHTREAVNELLSDSLAFYGAEAATTVVPYDRGKLSMPAAGACAPRAKDALDEVGRETLEGFEGFMLENSDTAGWRLERGDSPRCYMDVRLRASPALYADFVKDLRLAGMVKFNTGARSVVTPVND